MNFGDILDDWDKMTSRPMKRHTRAPRPEAGEAAPEPVSPLKSEPSANERMTAWLNRYGVQEKEEDTGSGRASVTKSSRETMRPDATIDLHGLTADDAVTRLGAFMENASRRGADMVLIIHGKGNHSAGEAVLGKAVGKALETIPCAGKRWEAPRRLGGSGALCVLVKKASG